MSKKHVADQGVVPKSCSEDVTQVILKDFEIFQTADTCAVRLADVQPNVLQDEIEAPGR